MEIRIDEVPINIQKISSVEYNQITLKFAESKYKEVRQKSKAPTFALT